MENLNNTVIKVLTKEHGKKVIDWWKSKGVNTRKLCGLRNEHDVDKFIYYGLINNNFNHYSLELVIANNAKIIELPTEDELPTDCEIPTLGKGVLMEVSDYKDFKDIEKRFVFGRTEKCYLAWNSAETESEIDYVCCSYWNYARPIKTEEIPEYTIEELKAKLGHEFKIKE